MGTNFRFESQITGCDFKPWTSRKDAAWYAYGTLLGESITRDTNSQGARALRYAQKLSFEVP